MTKQIDDEYGPWFNASANDGSSCVDARLRRDGNGAQLRDSKNPEAGAFTFNAAEWNAFVTGAKNGKFDLPSA